MSDVELTDDLLTILKAKRAVLWMIDDCKANIEFLEDNLRRLDELFEEKLAEGSEIPPIGTVVHLNGHYPEKIAHIWYEESINDVAILLESPTLRIGFSESYRSISRSEFKKEVQK